MQSLVSVALRGVDPVTHSVRLVVVHAGDDREYMVAPVSLSFVRLRILVKYDAYSIEVIDLIERNAFGVHLLPYRIWSLDSFLYLELETGFLQRGVNRCHELVNFLVFVKYGTVDLGSDFIKCLRLFVAEPDIFHFRFDSIQTETMGKRNEDEHCLAENLVSLMLRHELDRPAVVETVSQLDQHNTDIVVQGKQDAFEVLRLHALLFSLILVVENGLDLCQTFNEGSYLFTEEVAQVINCIISILHNIVQEGGND